MKKLRRLTLFFLFFMVFACSEADAQARSFVVKNPRVEQGGIIIIIIEPRWLGPGIGVSVFGNVYFPNRAGEIYIGIDRKAVPGKYIATLVQYNRRYGWDYGEIEIIGVAYPVRKRGPSRPSKRRLIERAEIGKAFSLGNPFEKYFDEPFVKPLDALVVGPGRVVGNSTSPFGNGHQGVDLLTLDKGLGIHVRPVKAINSGKVVMRALNFSAEGNMVILDHGSGIFSLYLHLSKTQVMDGDIVKAGDIIGFTGDSGNAKRGGPHLHFSVKVGNIYIDPLKFIDTMNQYLYMEVIQ